MFSTISSLASGQMNPQFVLPQQTADIVLGIHLNPKSASISILRPNPMYQPNEDSSLASLFHFRHGYLADASDIFQYAELVVATLQQCSGTTRTMQFQCA